MEIKNPVLLIGGPADGRYVDISSEVTVFVYPNSIIVNQIDQPGFLPVYDLDGNEDEGVRYKFRKMYDIKAPFNILPDNQVPDHVAIDQKYVPKGISSPSFSPSVLKAHAEACNRGHSHEVDGVKSWVILWLLDHVDWKNINWKEE